MLGGLGSAGGPTCPAGRPSASGPPADAGLAKPLNAMMMGTAPPSPWEST